LTTQIEAWTSNIEELEQNYFKAFEKTNLSTLEKDKDNTTKMENSNVEWQLEKHELEQRIAELETQLGSRVAGTPTSSTFGHEEPEERLAELSVPTTDLVNQESKSDHVYKYLSQIAYSAKIAAF
jgi:hypothetical protein